MPVISALHTQVEPGGSGVQVHSQLHGEFEVSLGYVRPRERREKRGGREGGIRKGRGRRTGTERRDRETQSYWIARHRDRVLN